MPPISRRYDVVAFALIALAGGALLGLAGWPQPDRTLEFCGLILAAMLTASLAMQQVSAKDWAMMPPSFVIDFTALLLLGPHAASLVAVAGAGMQGLADAQHPHRLRRAVTNAVTVVVAVQAAGLANAAASGMPATTTWPGQAVPIALALVSYCFVKCAAAEVVSPLIDKQPINRSWPASYLRGTPNYVVGAGIAVGSAAMIAHGAWQLVPVVAVPLYFAYVAYADYAIRRDEDYRRSEVVECLAQGMTVVDSNGIVIFWNEALENILDCPRQRVMGQSLFAALPVLAKTALPRLITDVLAGGPERTFALPAAIGGRMLHVRVLPVFDGVTLLWDDVTAITRIEHALKRSEERFELAAEGAIDGLWEWDLRNEEFHASRRWRTMLGMAPAAGVGPVAEWFDRVHADDLAELKTVLDSHLSGTMNHFQFSHRIRHEDGGYRRFLCRGAAVRIAGRAVRIAGSLTDSTDRTLVAGRLQSAGSLDALTGLGNRAVFGEALGRRLEEFKQQRRLNPFAVLYLDLDRFKVVNDSLGHMVGDELLMAVSRRLESCLRSGDALARLGGDEFAILLNEIGNANQANAIAFRIQEALSAPFSIGGREVFTSASIGIACGQSQYANAEEIMRDADTAMYHAKSSGKARHEMFDAAMHARELDRVGLENDLRHAINSNDFDVHYQPIVLLNTGMCVGFESLARWTRNGKPVPPSTFIPLAEELGLIDQLGTWALRQACSTFADWKRRYPASGLDYITVNVSGRQLKHQNFLRVVEQAVDAAKLAPSDLRLEITETALMDSPHEAAKLLRELRAFGVRIYLDDFGCGYSSLSHLSKLPVDALKIDRSFVDNLLVPDRPAIVESILALARTLQTGVVAEGIEHEAQGVELERLGCTHAQGYLYSRPVSRQAAEDIIVANQPLGPKQTQQRWPKEVLPRKSA